MRFLVYITMALMFTACSHIKRPMDPATATVKSSNLTDVSVAPPQGTSPEGVQRMLYKVAAITTVKKGFDKFQVVDNESWKKAGLDKQLGEFKKETFNTQFAPTASMSIRMYHNGEPGSENAMDATQSASPQTNTLDAIKSIR